ncbi:MAG: NAD(P)-binding protein, partial [Brachymonas sp.]|nr:NAD(P)-binding protein [Brachymonas sp.]
QLTTDYLIIGAGATGLAFADTLLQENKEAHLTIVDRHAKPGGHWNDAYPFVALHQPSAFYGVGSLELDSGRKDSLGHNTGLYELASGPEISGYFNRVMQQSLLPSGRVTYLPMSNVRPDGQIESLLSGKTTAITVRKKVVDATHFSPNVPSTHAPKYRVATSIQLIPPNGLTQLWQSAERPSHFCIVGAGKTGMDVGVWLLSNGVAPEAISWVMPRDSWLVNRVTTQPGEEFLCSPSAAQAKQLEALASATNVDDFFERLEAAGQMLRIDESVRPTMFHIATMSEGEVQLLRQIKQVIRKGRVQEITATGLTLDQGTVSMPENTLYINCSASAVEYKKSQPIFQSGKIVPQLVRAPLVSFSASLIAYVEAHYASDEQKNQLCHPVPFPHQMQGYIATCLFNMMNQMSWGQDKALRNWMRESRLDGFGKLVASVDPSDQEKIAVLMQLKNLGPAAAANAQKLMAIKGN